MIDMMCVRTSSIRREKIALLDATRSRVAVQQKEEPGGGRVQGIEIRCIGTDYSE